MSFNHFTFFLVIVETTLLRPTLSDLVDIFLSNHSRYIHLLIQFNLSPQSTFINYISVLSVMIS